MTSRRLRPLASGAVALLAFLAFSAAHAQTPSNWVQLNPAASPPARSGPGSAYDPVNGKVVIFGGYQILPSGAVVYLNDTWMFDGTTWTEVTGGKAPSPRTSTAMAYDAVEGDIVLFGGWDGGNRLGDTWVFDAKRGRWSSKRPKTRPIPASGAMGFQDPATGHAYVIGGFDGRFYYNTTWRWAGRNWERVFTATVPYARAAAICTLNPALGQVVMFGGIADVNPNNTWTWDGTDWTLQNPVNQPPGRYYSGAAYDSNAGGVVFFGAGDSDTWVWNGSDWTQLFPTNSPSPRALYAMTNEDALNHPILFGGEDTTGTVQFNDTWEFITGP